MYDPRHSMLRERRLTGSAMGALFSFSSAVLLFGSQSYAGVMFGVMALTFFTLAREAHLSLPASVDGPSFTPVSAWRMTAAPAGLTHLRLAALLVAVTFVAVSITLLYSPLIGAVAAGVAAAVAVGIAQRLRKTKLRSWELRVQLTQSRYVELRASAHVDTICLWNVSGEASFNELGTGPASFPAEIVEAELDSIGVGVLEATLQTQLMRDAFEARWAEVQHRLPPLFSDARWG